jgi:hypothetical protein
MTTLCPDCATFVEVPDDLMGARAVCPSCNAVVPPPTPDAPPAVPPDQPAAPPAFAAVEPPGAGLARVRIDTAVAGCLGLLRAAVLLDVLVGVICLVNAYFRGLLDVGPDLPVMAPLSLLLFVPLVWIVAGVGALQRRTSLGLARTAAYCALFVGALTALPTVAAAWGILRALAADRPENAFALVLVLVVALNGTICALLGGARALALLARPDVRQAFRGGA